MTYFLILISITAAALNSTLLHKIPASAKNNIFSFNFYCSVEWILILAMLGKGKININGMILFWGIIYGMTQVLFLVFKTKAMSSGPVSITTLIGNCSLLLSTSAGIIIWHEKISVLQIVGIIILLFSVIVCTYSKSDIAMPNIWKIYSAAFFIFAAAVGIVFKFFSKSSACENASDMMLVSAVVMSIFLFFLSALKHAKSDERKQIYNLKYISVMIPCGILSCLYNRLNIYLAGTLPSAFFFPVFNGGVIILSSVMSIFLLKEQLTFKQIFGLVLGTVSIVITGIF